MQHKSWLLWNKLYIVRLLSLLSVHSTARPKANTIYKIASSFAANLLRFFYYFVGKSSESEDKSSAFDVQFARRGPLKTLCSVMFASKLTSVQMRKQIYGGMRA